MLDLKQIDLLAVLVTLIVLLYSSYHDLKTREVSDKVWMIYAPIAAGLTLLRLVLYPHLLTLTFISILITFFLSFAVFYLGLFGGADAKALLCVGLALPLNPSAFTPSFGQLHPFFPLAILYNAYLFSACLVFYALIKNLVWIHTTNRKLFSDIEYVPLYQKALALLTGYKIDIKTFRDRPHLYPMERIINGEEGEEKRRELSLYIDLEADRDNQVETLMSYHEERGSGDVWVTPGLPLLFFILISLISNIIVGDILVGIAVSITMKII